MTRYLPPSIRNKGLQNHLSELGVDYNLFIKLIESDTPIKSMGRILQSKGKKPHAWETVRRWIVIYKEEQANITKGESS